MLDVTTTITVNGAQGDRFLASLSGYRAPVPRALRWLAASIYRSIEVGRSDAEQVASFVQDLLDAGWIRVDEPPLLFSPRVGDHVLVCRDVLAEIGRHAPGLPPTWRFLPAGATGRLLGWRGEHRAVIEVHGMDRRLVVYMSERNVTRIPTRR
jgi:hypothetical protein